MSAINFIEIARQRRIDALDLLKTREDNLFSIADYRMRARRTAPSPVFASTRKPALNLFVVEGDDRLAA